jgi:hypothetical protein
VEWYWQGKPKNAEINLSQWHLHVRIPHGLTLLRTQASEMTGQLLTAWSLAQNNDDKDDSTTTTNNNNNNTYIRFFPIFHAYFFMVSSPEWPSPASSCLYMTLRKKREPYYIHSPGRRSQLHQTYLEVLQTRKSADQEIDQVWLAYISVHTRTEGCKEAFSCLVQPL